MCQVGSGKIYPWITLVGRTETARAPHKKAVFKADIALVTLSLAISDKRTSLLYTTESPSEYCANDHSAENTIRTNSKVSKA